MRRILLSAIFVGFCTYALGQSAPSGTPSSTVSDAVPTDPDAFTSYVATALSGAFPGRSAKIAGPLKIRFSAADKAATATLSLDRIHTECLSHPTQCRETVERFVSFWRDTTAAAPPPTLANLWASLEPSNWRAHYAKVYGEDGSPLVSRPFVGQLDVVCEIDPERPGHFLGRAQLKDLHLTADAALDLCISNTVKRQRPFADSIPDIAPGEVGAIHSSEAVAILLVHDQWAQVAARFGGGLGGGLLVASPDSDNIYYGRGSDDASVAAVKARAHKQVADANPKAPGYANLCCEVYRWTPTGWDVAAEP